ncbi:MAG: 3'(2'),5'-bisphosphate nucleotidase CysQ [Ponticaulis sp.]|nr:3'(2'),5'-bisphosphate nucleotidase CysQ [Ponticaulis sp.]
MPVGDLHADLRLLRDSALEAGAIAMTYFESNVKTWEKEPDHPVTEADIAVNDFLADKLRSARPDYGWLSEENADTPERLSCDRVFVVDPIDGTRAFMNGQPHFCVALCVLEFGEPVVSVLYAPVFNELYSALIGHGARCNGRSISVSEKAEVDNCRMIGDARLFNHDDWPDVWPEMVYPDVHPNSTAYRMALVADGRWDAVVILRRKFDWDVAASALLVTEAGGNVSCHWGDTFRYNRQIAAQRSLIAANPVLHGQLTGRMRHIELPEPNDS